MCKTGFGFWFLFLLTLRLLPAQVYTATNFSLNEGLVQSQVRAILQDSQGYLWLGTHRGISRFDGRNFTNFSPDDGLAGTYVHAIIEDSAGHVWMGTDGGLSRFDGLAFQNFSRSDGLSGNTILCMLYDRDHKLWIGSQEGGVTVWQNGVFSRNPFPTNSILSNVAIYAMTQDSDGNIWLGTRSGLFLYNGETLSRFGEDFLPPDSKVYSLLSGPDGSLWVGTDRGAFRFEGESLTPVPEAPGIRDNNFYCMLRDPEGGIWLGTGEGIVRLIDGSLQPYFPKDWTSRNEVHAAICDREGNLWFGTEGEGTYRIRKGNFLSYSVENGLSSNIVKSFLEDEDGNIWISTTNNGINRFDGKKFSYLGEESGLSNNKIVYSFEDSRGDFWFTSYTEGVSRYRDGKFQVFRKEDGLISNVVFCVEEDKEGKLWFGTESGISVYDGTSFSGFTTRDGLVHNTVYAILAGSNGEIWIGGPEGVSRFKEGVFSRFAEADTLSDNFVLTIREDKRGNLWFGTREGLCVFDGKRFRSFSVDAASGANDVIALTLDTDKYIWLGTNYGVYRLDLKLFYEKDSAAFKHFGITEGLPSLECNANAAFRDSKGNIWIGTIGGAICYPANGQKEENALAPLTHITDLRLFRGLESLPTGNNRKDPRTGLPANLRLPHNKNYLTFDFIGISLKNPLAVRYRFMLEPFDKGWLPATHETSATYSNLEPGDYRFRVKAADNSGTWTTYPVEYRFTIRPPYWQRWWFILAMAILAGLIGYGIYLIIRDRIRRKREEEQMKIKSEILQLEQQALYAMMNPHFTFNALQSIQYYIHKQDPVSANKFLSSFAKLIRKNLDSTQSDFISLGEEVERLKLYLSLEKMRFKGKFEYVIAVSPQIDQNETLIPPMILQPFVENSIKHGIMPLGGNGEVRVTINPMGADYLEIRVADNGIGVVASRKQKEGRPQDHVSKGMQLTEDRLKLFARMTGRDFNLQINEVPGEDGKVGGTEVVIKLPFHREN